MIFAGMVKGAFKKAASTRGKRTLIENFFSLSALQFANYILPLVTFPYLVRVLGPEKFGLIAFAQALIQYFIISTDYGFNYSATRDISVNRNDSQKVSNIFNSVILIKLTLCLIGFLILCALILIVPKFKADASIYVYTFGMVLGSAIFPTWFFQGMERMKYIAILSIIGKLFFTFAIFLFITRESDYIYVPIINSLGLLINGIVALFVIHNKFKIKYEFPKIRNIKDQLFEGYHIFISTVAISFYTTSNTVILGLFTNNTIVGYYSAAAKIIDAVIKLLAPFSQAVYPYISRLESISREKALLFIRKIFIFVASGSFLVSISILFFTEPIVRILLGNKYGASVMVLKILAFLPFFVGMNNVLGIQTMLTLGLKKAFSKIIITAAVLNIALALILTPLYKHIGISICAVITEIFVAMSIITYLIKAKIIGLDFLLCKGASRNPRLL